MEALFGLGILWHLISIGGIVLGAIGIAKFLFHDLVAGLIWIVKNPLTYVAIGSFAGVMALIRYGKLYSLFRQKERELKFEHEETGSVGASSFASPTPSAPVPAGSDEKDRIAHEVKKEMERRKMEEERVKYEVKKTLSVQKLKKGTERKKIRDFRKMSDAEFEKRLRMMKNEILGQDRALREIEKALRAIRMGIRSGRKPPVILLIGEAGTGKTQTVKALAKYFFEGRLLLLPMNQYSDEHTSWALFGAPKGYAGSDEGGDLTQGVKNEIQGNGVIGLDEIEKAHPGLWKHFFQAFDEGRLKDISFDEWVDVSDCIFVMTSNIGQVEAERLANAFQEELRGFVQSELSKRAGTEVGIPLTTRIDRIVVYTKLPEDALRILARREAERALSDAGLQIDDMDTFVEYVVEKTRKGSVRDMRRIVEDSILQMVMGEDG